MSVALVQTVPYVDTRWRVPDHRPFLRALGFGLGGIATALGLVGSATWTSAWMVTVALSGHPNGPFAQPKPSLRSLALAESAPMLLGPAQMPKVVVVPVPEPAIAETAPAWPAPVAAAVPDWPDHAPVRTFAALPAAPAAEPPLPLARPRIETARAPAAAPPAAAARPIERQAALVPPAPKMPALPPPGSRIALYDISGHTVYLPDGRRLEAHSGVGERMDDPRYTKVRMRGPTPPNIYRLSMREALFHGVRAIRLKPLDEGKMFGRDGMLAHTYMLGPTGQSNGCVSFKHYDTFLQAFLNGEVDRMVVVPHLSEAPVRIAEAMRDRVAAAE